MRKTLILALLLLFAFPAAAGACEGFNNAMDALEHDLREKKTPATPAAPSPSTAPSSPAPAPPDPPPAAPVAPRL